MSLIAAPPLSGRSQCSGPQFPGAAQHCRNNGDPDCPGRASNDGAYLLPEVSWPCRSIVSAASCTGLLHNQLSQDESQTPTLLHAVHAA